MRQSDVEATQEVLTVTERLKSNTEVAEVAQHIARTIRPGQMITITTEPGIGALHSLMRELPDYGHDYREVRHLYIANVSEALFVEILNDIRLKDQVLILNDFGPDDEATKIALFNVEHCFTRHGGRAVIVKH
jgi:hypothetical protein